MSCSAPCAMLLYDLAVGIYVILLLTVSAEGIVWLQGLAVAAILGIVLFVVRRLGRQAPR
jgi:hypothetical protein